MLAGTLKGVISQRLVPTPDGDGRVAVCEILRMTGRARDMIIDPEQTGRLREVIAEGEYYGMQTFDQALLRHYQAGRVSMEEALRVASSPHDFKLLVAAEGRTATSMEDLGDATHAVSPATTRQAGPPVAAPRRPAAAHRLVCAAPGRRRPEPARVRASISDGITSEQAISLESASAASRWAWIFRYSGSVAISMNRARDGYWTSSTRSHSESGGADHGLLRLDRRHQPAANRGQERLRGRAVACVRRSAADALIDAIGVRLEPQQVEHHQRLGVGGFG